MKNKIKLLKDNPGRIFGLIYPYILVIGVALGLYYIDSLTSITRQQVSLRMPDTTAQSDLPVMKERNIAAVNIDVISQPADSLIQNGEAIYKSLCASCHGEKGLGDGLASTGLNPPPRNFTKKDGWKNGPGLTQIFETLQQGIAGTAMAPFQQLSTAEKFELAHYIRNTFVSDPPPADKSELMALDQTYNLSKEQVIPAQIPIMSAMNIIAEENNSKMQKINEVLNKISSSKNEVGYKIFNDVTTNKVKALTILNASDSWKQNENTFMDMIINNVNQNGFNRKVFYLTDAEWNTLFGYVGRFF